MCCGIKEEEKIGKHPMKNLRYLTNRILLRAKPSAVIQPLPAVAVSLHAHILSASLSTSKT